MKAIVVNKNKSPLRSRNPELIKNEKIEKLEAEGLKLREKLSITTKIIENYKKQKKKQLQVIEELKHQTNSIEEESNIY
jgi:hypothetical protein